MLSGPLLMVTFRKERASPKFLKGEPEQLSLAEGLLSAMETLHGESRETAEEVLKEAQEGNPKVIEGMIKILLERAKFRAPETDDPALLRSQVFDAAADYWSHRAEHHEQLETHRERILGPLGLNQPERLENPLVWLFSDLSSNQELESFEPMTPAQLIDRYNLEQAQGLMLKATSLQLSIRSKQSLQPLMQMLKFFGLLFRVEQNRPSVTSLVVDGPTSVLENARSYGLELANFFGAVVSLAGPWELKAEIRLPDKKGPFYFMVEHNSGYRVPRRIMGQWSHEKILALEKRFNEQYDPGYHAETLTEVVGLANNRYLLPDLKITQGKKQLRLQWIRYLNPEREAWLRSLKADLPKDYYFVVKGKPAQLKSLVQAMDGRLALVATEITAPFLKRLIEQA
ncbi:MAG: DUF790 family protein [bacterium]|nr:DUF790 family protein [bacterium]